MKNIFIAIIVIVMLPLLFASLSDIGDSGNQELKGFSARDIQYIESIGFVDNLDGSWTLTTLATISTNIYYFDYSPLMQTNVIRTQIIGMMQNSSNSLTFYDGSNSIGLGISIPIILWGGDVS